MYKPPKSKMIKGEKWITRWKWNLKDDDGNECYGLCEHKTRTIWLDRMIPKDMVQNVYFHEELHAVIHELCVPLKADIEESIVEGIERYVMKNYKLRPIK